MARNLVKLGRYEDARGWLNKLIEMKSSVASVQEAQKLLSEIDKRTGKSSEVTIGRHPAPAIPGIGNAQDEPLDAPATVRYYAQDTATDGIRYRELPPSIQILQSPEGAKPIGTAAQSGSTDDGKAAWKLTVRGAALSGQFVPADREFKRISDSGAGQSSSDAALAIC